MSERPFSFDLRSDSGLVAAEFVVVAFALLVMVFLVVELTTLYFSMMSEQKAAYMGARVAIVSNVAATGVPARNTVTGTGTFGVSCGDASAPCAGFAPASCDGDGGGCDASSFSRILSRMRQFVGGLEAAHVTIRYAYAGLGFAGGPTIPEVTVTIHGVPYRTGIIGGIIGTAHGAFTSLPPVSVTLMGEDLSQSGG